MINTYYQFTILARKSVYRLEVGKERRKSENKLRNLKYGYIF